MPKAMRLIADNGRLHVMIEGRRMGTVTTLEFVDDEDPDRARVLGYGVLPVLSLIQDDVSEYLREPWPSKNGREMAMPDVRMDADALHLWYGDSEETAVVGMPPISIAELSSGSAGGTP